MISMSVTLTVLFFVILGALFGLAKGFKKSVLRLITVAVSAIVTYFISGPITRLFITKKNIHSLAGLLNFEENYNDLIAVSPAAEELICALVAAIVTTIVFILLFFIIKGIIAMWLCLRWAWAEGLMRQTLLTPPKCVL